MIQTTNINLKDGIAHADTVYFTIAEEILPGTEEITAS